MNRRELLARLVALGAMGAAEVAWPQSAATGSKKRLGVLALLPAAETERLALSRLRTELQRLGWTDGQNLVIEGAYADNRQDRLPALAEELLRKRPDALWVGSTAAAIAAARLTQSIPTVFFSVAWPVETGLIGSFARPGGNVTGVALYAGLEVSIKRLEFLREFAPAAKRLSWILESSLEETVDGRRWDFRPLIEAPARKLGYEVRFHYVRSSTDVDGALAEVLDWRAQALMVSGGIPIFVERGRIAEFALQHRLPSASVMEPFVAAGGLLSYNAKDLLTVNVAKSAAYLDRIFRGARPADLPVERPDRYELVVNAKTARAIGLPVPQSLRMAADRVIE
jgi:putative ABC transport system substrate-binding protein